APPPQAPGAPSRAEVLPIVIVPKDATLDIFFKNVAERWYGRNGNSSSGPWHELDAEVVPSVLRVGDALETIVPGAWDSSSPIICGALPFAPPAQSKASALAMQIYSQLGWTSYPAQAGRESEDWSKEMNAHLMRDGQGVVVSALQVGQTCQCSARAPLAAAVEYLTRYAEVLE